jgi:hypothetical protein
MWLVEYWTGKVEYEAYFQNMGLNAIEAAATMRDG